MCIFLCSLSNCEKDPDPTPQLPPKTQEGKNTFGCLVNGQVWLPKGGGLLIGLACDYSQGTLLINANNGNTDESIKINLLINDTGMIEINGEQNQNIYYRKGLNYFYADSLSIGYLTITKLDTINKIIAGTFYFDAVKNTTRYEIREGRFDLKLYN